MPNQSKKKETIKTLNSKLVQVEDIDKLAMGVKFDIRDLQAKAQDQLMQQLAKFRSKDETPSEWYAKQIQSLTEFQKKFNNVLKTEERKILDNFKENSKELHLSGKQYQNQKNGLKQASTQVIDSSIQQHKRNISNIYTKTIQSNSAQALQKQIFNLIEHDATNGATIYKNGKYYRTENYMEMKIRTELNNEVANNMLETGQKFGVIFYTCCQFGDCAPDHAWCQDKGLFVDENWQSQIDDEDVRQQIDAYIQQHKIPTMQEVMDAPYYFTTRPNCRHYFQYIDTDSVLEIKSKEKLQDYRREEGLLIGGKYKPEKYEALQQQRKLERDIRTAKEMANAEAIIFNSSDDKISITSLIHQKKHYDYVNRVKKLQKQQRELLKKNNWLTRQSFRESTTRNVTMGLKQNQNQVTIKLEDASAYSIEKTISKPKREILKKAIEQKNPFLFVSTSKRDMTLMERVPKVASQIDNGSYAIGFHCRAGGLSIINGRDGFTPNDVAKIITGRGEWKEGQPITLLACSSGVEKDGVCMAQEIADKLGVEVYAPTKILYFYHDYTTSPKLKDFKKFTPRK